VLSPEQRAEIARVDDVLPALKQGTIDGALGNLQVFTAFRYYDTTKYMNETGHAFTFSFAAISKRWFVPLPPDLQATEITTAQEIGEGGESVGNRFPFADCKSVMSFRSAIIKAILISKFTRSLMPTSGPTAGTLGSHS